jgi:hypothetical protein
MGHATNRRSLNTSNHISALWRPTELDMPFNYTVSNLPLLFPVTITIPLGTTQTVSFPDQFAGRAVAVKIRNNDGANDLSYTWNLNPEINIIASSSFDTIDGTTINYLTITTGGAGTATVQAQVLPIQQSEVIELRKSIKSYGEF